jgi:hypothetical protein
MRSETDQSEATRLSGGDGDLGGLLLKALLETV